MAAVADTSPLIFLAKVNRLTLLSELYGEVFIPPAVVMELQVKPDKASPEIVRFIQSARVEAPKDVTRLGTFSGSLGRAKQKRLPLRWRSPVQS